jgi:hypothetical protein
LLFDEGDAGGQPAFILLENSKSVILNNQITIVRGLLWQSNMRKLYDLDIIYWEG